MREPRVLGSVLITLLILLIFKTFNPLKDFCSVKVDSGELSYRH